MPNDQTRVSDIKTQKKVISWISPEFIYHPKEKSWYISATTLAVILLVFFSWQKMYAAIAVVAASVLALFMQARLKPKNIKYTLSADGLEFRGKNYPFNELKSFWIVVGSLSSKLYLKKTAKFSNPISVELIKIDPESIRNYLQQYLPEENQQSEHMSERISRFMKF